MAGRDEIEARLAAATPGPWHAWDRGIGYEIHIGAEHIEPLGDGIFCEDLNRNFRETFTQGDAEFIVHAPEDIRSLLAGLQATKDALREALLTSAKQQREIEDLQASYHWLQTESLGLLDSVAAGLEADALIEAHRAESARFRADATRQRVESNTPSQPVESTPNGQIDR